MRERELDAYLESQEEPEELACTLKQDTDGSYFVECQQCNTYLVVEPDGEDDEEAEDCEAGFECCLQEIQDGAHEAEQINNWIKDIDLCGGCGSRMHITEVDLDG